MKAQPVPVVILRHGAETVTDDGFKKRVETRDKSLAIIDAPNSWEPRDGAAKNEVVDYVLYLPPGTSVAADDRIELDGVIYEVEGESPPLRNQFTGATFYTEVKVRCWNGKKK